MRWREFGRLGNGWHFGASKREIGSAVIDDTIGGNDLLRPWGVPPIRVIVVHPWSKKCLLKNRLDGLPHRDVYFSPQILNTYLNAK
jgi:hypothetical protein